jgi:hypothetical protein
MYGLERVPAIPVITTCVLVITTWGYYKLPYCYSRTIAYFHRKAMLILKRRFSAEHFHRFFRGRDSMKWDEENCR